MIELQKKLEELIGLTKNESEIFCTRMKVKDYKAKTSIIKEANIARKYIFY